MSVFTVKLQQPMTHAVSDDSLMNGLSLQRTVSLTGPNGVTRVLRDGESFTDSNYFKRFCYPALPRDKAFLEVTVDDGSTYVGEDSTYPKVYNLEVDGGTTYTDAANVANVAADTGSYATSAQIRNLGMQDVRIKLNDSAILTLPGESVQSVDIGEFAITMIAVDNSDSGATATEVEILLGVAGGSLT